MPPQKFADLSYKHKPFIRFAVDRIDVAHKFIMPNLQKKIGAEMPVKPSTVANQWAKDRLRAVGGENIIQVTIAQASIVEVPLLVKDGIQGIFTNDQSERYDGTIEIKIEVKNKKGKQLGMISSKSNRSQTVPEDTTITERKKGNRNLGHSIKRILSKISLSAFSIVKIPQYDDSIRNIGFSSIFLKFS